MHEALILDNPIWQALCTGNAPFAHGTAAAKYLKRDMGFFAGLQTNSEAALRELHTLLPPAGRAILFVRDELSIPANWNLALKKPLLQMVYRQAQLPPQTATRPVPLGESHIPAMLQLTALTNPGPFLSRTIDFGNYEGIFEGNMLVAMAGQRLQPDPYTEISAVCTHTQHTGKGYAATLINSQIKKITAASRIPFLHLFPDNVAAFNLYKKLGFESRTELWVYMLEKKDESHLRKPLF